MGHEIGIPAPDHSPATPDPAVDDEAPLEVTLPGDAYLSEQAWRRERERIFLRQWVCVGREETIPDAGDYLQVDVAGESVLVVRDKDGSLKGFYNVCRHRGAQLVSEEAPAVPDGAAPCRSGRFRGAIVCPYHAWTYALSGELRQARFLDERHGLRREQLALHEAGVAAWGGFVFVHLTAREAEPLAGQLGHVPENLRRYPLDRLRTARRITYDVAANWKVLAENYNECYHCGPVHPELCDLVPAFRQNGGAELDWEGGVPHREGAWTFTASGTSDRQPFPGLSAEERVRHKGDLVYPNLLISCSADHVAAFVLRPDGPGRTVVTCDFLFDPDEMRRPGFDPSDAVEFWDVVNRQDWKICESVQRGMSARPFDTGYYAPMEDAALDIRRYIRDRLGET
ncbi:aromatic ring-hydroxylating dioxygenase subunit alpha [Streptomyces sp. NPDC127178]|uniref:aromatic ring-hydroxylating oxygenase subunit alpha n=1 Tax=unclassified Streptomyces TaxID=2593676 RepID=UPI00363DE0A6